MQNRELKRRLQAIDSIELFARLSPDEKKWFAAACTSANEFLRAYTTKDESEAYEFLKGQGMQVNLTPDVESFRVACASVIEKNPDLFVPELVKAARATAA